MSKAHVPDANDCENYLITKWQMRIGILAAILVPFASAMAAYYSTIGGIRQSVAGVRADVIEARLESERAFAKRADVETMRDKINTIASDVSEIKGYLKGRR